MKLEEFINKNKPKKKTSVFDEYLDDIKTLQSLNYSQTQIIQYLKSKPNNKNKAGLSEPNLSSYLKKIRKSEDIEKSIDLGIKETTSNKSKKQDKSLDIFKNLK